MIFHSYPFRTYKIILVLIVASALLVSACRKDTDRKPPNMNLLTGSGYITESSVVPIGYPYKIGITAAEGDAAITNLIVTLTTENGRETALDSGMYSHGFTYVRSNSYGAALYEKWTFYIRDKNGKSSVASLTINKDTTSTFGPITYYQSVILGAQNCTLYNPLFSIGVKYLLQRIIMPLIKGAKPGSPGFKQNIETEIK